MSAFATVIGGLDMLSESELRQLYLVVGVRLGNPDPSVGSLTPTSGTGKARGSAPKKHGAPSKKGNPSRKSQWMNHPLYQEYRRLEKVVQLQAKEQKCSFNSVLSEEFGEYKIALNHWLTAKHSFRDRSGHQENEADDGKSSAEEEAAQTLQTSTNNSEAEFWTPGGSPEALFTGTRVTSWADEMSVENDGISVSSVEN